MVNIHPQMAIFLALVILLIPLRWVIAWFFAMTLHELCHIIAVILCRKSIYSATISPHGMVLHSEPLSPVQNMFCSLAGPTGGFVFAFLLRRLPRFALCALMQSAYNLLPVYPLDGSHALRAFLHMILPEKAAIKFAAIVEWIALGILACECLYLAIQYDFGMLPIIFVALLAAKSGKIKIPCKDAVHRVQ